MPNQCNMCKNEEESVGYLLLHCPKDSILWLIDFSVFWSSLGDAVHCKRKSIGMDFFGKRRKRYWKASLCLFCTLWKEKNRRSLEDSEQSN